MVQLPSPFFYHLSLLYSPLLRNDTFLRFCTLFQSLSDIHRIHILVHVLSRPTYDSIPSLISLFSVISTSRLYTCPPFLYSAISSVFLYVYVSLYIQLDRQTDRQTSKQISMLQNHPSPEFRLQTKLHGALFRQRYSFERMTKHNLKVEFEYQATELCANWFLISGGNACPGKQDQ